MSFRATVLSQSGGSMDYLNEILDFLLKRLIWEEVKKFLKRGSMSKEFEEHYCKYCSKQLSYLKGEVAHGCLDCADSPVLTLKIDRLQAELEKLENAMRKDQMWAIHSNDVGFIYGSARRTRVEAITYVFGQNKEEWGNAKRNGYSCRKVCVVDLSDQKERK